MKKELFDYFHHNPKGYWFKAKRFGWGWTPVTWQGWLVVVVYIALLIGFATTLDDNSPAREIMLMFVLPFVILTAALIRICYKKGEKPGWNWGFKKK